MRKKWIEKENKGDKNIRGEEERTAVSKGGEKK